MSESELLRGVGIASLEYTLNDRVSDKDIRIDKIIAIERKDTNTFAIRMEGGYTAFVPPKIAMEVMKLWHRTADYHEEIKAT